MINYSSRRLGQSLFDKIFPTSPGRVDPRTGMIMHTGYVPLPELRTMVVDRSRGGERGRGDDRGYGRGRGDDRDRSYDRGDDRGYDRSDENRYPRMRNDFGGADRPILSGPGSSPGILENPLTWILVGAGIFIALEATGVTKLSAQA